MPRRVRHPNHVARPIVALVTHDIHEHGGMSRTCYQLIRHLHEDVGFVVVAASLAGELEPLVEDWIRIKVPSTPFPAKFGLFYVRAGRALSRLDVDLTHVVGAIVPNCADVAAVYHCHAGFRAITGARAPSWAPPLRRFNTSLTHTIGYAAEKWSYRPRRLRAFAAVSDRVSEQLGEHYPDLPIVMTPSGADLNTFCPDEAVRVDFRRRFQVGDTFVALFLGGDWDRKGLGVAIEAVSLARSRGCPVELWVVGLGERGRFSEMAEGLGISAAVRFWGQPEQIAEFYRAADVFVLPSVYETFSLPAVEAAASSLPLLVTSESGVAPELVGENVGGRVVDRNAQAFATALIELANRDLRSTLGEEAHRRAQHYGWDRSAAAMLALYVSLLENG